MSSRFDIERFLQSIGDKELPEIIRIASREAESCENDLYGQGQIKGYDRDQCLKYVKALKELLFILRVGGFPSGLEGKNKELFRQFIEKLVMKGVFEEGILGIFG